jgi:hypothetical protein
MDFSGAAAANNNGGQLPVGVAVSTLTPVSELAALRSACTEINRSIHTVRFLIFLDILFSIFSIIVFPIALARAGYNRATYGNFTLGWLFVAASAATVAVEVAKQNRSGEAPPAKTAGVTATATKKIVTDETAESNEKDSEAKIIIKKYIEHAGLKQQDCGSGNGSNGCFFASVLAQSPGGSMNASKAECDALRLEIFNFGVDLYKDAVTGSKLSENEKEVVTHCIEEVTNGKKTEKLTEKIRNSLKNMIQQGKNRLSPTGDWQNGKIDPTEDEKDRAEYVKGQESYFSGRDAIKNGNEVASPSTESGDSVAHCRGYDAMKNLGIDESQEAFYENWVVVSLENLKLLHIIGDDRTQYTRLGVQIIENELNANPPESANLQKILVGLFYLYYTDLFFNKNEFHRLHEPVPGGLADDLGEEIGFPKTNNLPAVIMAFFQLVFHGSKSGNMAESTDIAFMALKLGRPIIVYSAGFHGNSEGVFYFGEKGSSFLPPVENLPPNPIYIYHSGCHFQAYVHSP